MKDPATTHKNGKTEVIVPKRNGTPVLTLPYCPAYKRPWKRASLAEISIEIAILKKCRDINSFTQTKIVMARKVLNFRHSPKK